MYEYHCIRSSMTEVPKSIQIIFGATVHIRKSVSLPKDGDQCFMSVCSSNRVESEGCGTTLSENSLSPLSSQETSTAHQPSTKVSHIHPNSFHGIIDSDIVIIFNQSSVFNSIIKKN